MSKTGRKFVFHGAFKTKRAAVKKEGNYIHDYLFLRPAF